MSDELKAISFIAQLYRVTLQPDGGGKIVLEFGGDALEAIQELQRLYAAGQGNLAISIVPFNEGN